MWPCIQNIARILHCCSVIAPRSSSYVPVGLSLFLEAWTLLNKPSWVSFSPPTRSSFDIVIAWVNSVIASQNHRMRESEIHNYVTITDNHSPSRVVLLNVFISVDWTWVLRDTLRVPVKPLPVPPCIGDIRTFNAQSKLETVHGPWRWSWVCPSVLEPVNQRQACVYAVV